MPDALRRSLRSYYGRQALKWYAVFAVLLVAVYAVFAVTYQWYATPVRIAHVAGMLVTFLFGMLLSAVVGTRCEAGARAMLHP